MSIPRRPDSEAERLAALHSLHILDTPPEERFDRITRTARRLFRVPIALVSLVDSERQWFKSCYGLSLRETERDISFCALAILRPESLVVPDALADPRFSENPLVRNDPYIRFYAGHPLTSPDGHRLGTLCIIDRRPRQFDGDDLHALQDLAQWAQSELNSLELGEAVARLRESERRLHALFHRTALGIALVDSQARLLTTNPALQQMLGQTDEGLRGLRLDQLGHLEEQGRGLRLFADLIQGKMDGYQREIRLTHADGTPRWMLKTVSLVRDDAGAPRFAYVMFWDITRRHTVEEKLAQALEAEQAARQRVEQLSQVQAGIISMITHDFRTALTGIQGFSELMADEDLAVRDLRDYAAEVHQAAQRMNGMIAEMLDLERRAREGQSTRGPG